MCIRLHRSINGSSLTSTLIINTTSPLLSYARSSILFFNAKIFFASFLQPPPLNFLAILNRLDGSSLRKKKNQFIQGTSSRLQVRDTGTCYGFVWFVALLACYSTK